MPCGDPRFRITNDVPAGFPPDHIANVIASPHQRPDAKQTGEANAALICQAVNAYAENAAIRAELVAALEGICLSLDAHEGESSPKWLRSVNAQAHAAIARAKKGTA